MKINRLVPVLIASMFALSLNFIGAGQAQAAACSKYDRGMWFDNESTNVQFATILALISGEDEDIYAVLDLTDEWIKKTKNKKVKAAVIKFQTEFEKGAATFNWKTSPKFTDARSTLASMFKLNRC